MTDQLEAAIELQERLLKLQVANNFLVAAIEGAIKICDDLDDDVACPAVKAMLAAAKNANDEAFAEPEEEEEAE